MRYRSLLLLTVCLLTTHAFAQNEEDALRISTIAPGGTARSAGLANAFGALGGDGSAIALNPAGFGVYRTSELSFTPSLEVNDVTSTYHGLSAADTETRFHFSNLTLAINNQAKAESDWRSSTYGVSFDRQATHHWRHQAEGRNVDGSVLHHFHNEITQANILPEEFGTALPFSGSLAWETYALDTLDGVLYPLIPFGATTDQTHTRETRGAATSTSFFFAGNYKDRLYLGASLGVSGHRFRRNLVQRETTVDENEIMREVTYREEVATTGNGFELKIGAIGRITEQFRMGLAFHSPQWLQLNDAYVMRMSTDFRVPFYGQMGTEEFSPDGVFNYRLNTPWRVLVSAAFIAGPNGLFSLEYEYADMRRMRFRPSSRIVDDYDFRTENNIIRDVFQPVHTVRAGTEWRTGAWYYRLGFGYATDPYVGTDARHGSPFRHYAGGIGYRTDHVGVDLAFNVQQRGIAYLPYSGAEPISAELATYRTMLTLSFRP